MGTVIKILRHIKVEEINTISSGIQNAMSLKPNFPHTKTCRLKYNRADMNYPHRLKFNLCEHRDAAECKMGVVVDEKASDNPKQRLVINLPVKELSIVTTMRDEKEIRQPD